MAALTQDELIRRMQEERDILMKMHREQERANQLERELNASLAEVTALRKENAALTDLLRANGLLPPDAKRLPPQAVPGPQSAGQSTDPQPDRLPTPQLAHPPTSQLAHPPRERRNSQPVRGSGPSEGVARSIQGRRSTPWPTAGGRGPSEEAGPSRDSSGSQAMMSTKVEEVNDRNYHDDELIVVEDDSGTWEEEVLGQASQHERIERPEGTRISPEDGSGVQPWTFLVKQAFRNYMW
ncbi:hypothetical protein HK101_001839 [Irineochytrium annulatum]|nr:hypothetical protein HK101_001839 [Irineochytrium annulatum]